MKAHFHLRDPDAPTPNTYRRFGVNIVLLDADASHVLLEHRADSDLWGLFGGAVDDDESALQALHREIREETSLELASWDLLGVFSDPTRILAYPDGAVLQSISVSFIGRLADGDPVMSDESSGCGWFAWVDIPWDQVPASQAPTLRYALDFLRTRVPHVD